MNLKMILGITLLVLNVLGAITYGYIMYSVNADAAATFAKVKLMAYAELVIQLLSIGAGALMVYKT